ncbi:polysaccharide biosynthesis/export family protein [Anaerobaca lacustris]|uniref:SLBB domain-containing protein n=1 Tax=Anaerobaca lacustris TaxID=3044600 RepID=A0AAW6U1Q5_9BACT|nr:SLBB domain-containing protein [Sedimentisphaerales bacterium M17dextr]
MAMKTIPGRVAGLVVVIGLSFCLLGCGDRIRPPSAERLTEFEMAGPQGPSVDMDRMRRARMPVGLYRVALGDVLELTMPLTLFPDLPAGVAAIAGTTTRRCRVDDAGSITLPDGRQMSVVGKSLAEIESMVADAYYPQFVKNRPLIYAQVIEYRTRRVQILGGVTRPGFYDLRHDQMSLVALLTEAGGIVDEGAAVIRITSGGRTNGPSAESPDRGLSPLRDVPREHGRVRTGVYGRRAALTRDALSDSPSQMRMRFTPEGRLVTTGWVVLERDGDMLVRAWLDIANGPQKRVVLETAAAKQERLPVALLDGRLLQLEQMLLSGGGGARVHLAVLDSHPDWQRTGEGDYVTSLPDVPYREETGHAIVADLEELSGPVAAAPEETDATIVLPVRGLNIPFADVALDEGDSVVVERLQIQYVTVLGLVRTPGNFPYPVDAQYRLAEVLAFAGGLDMIAAPRYVSVYRLKADGTVASATFRLVDPRHQEELTAQLALAIKPGDVVSVEHTPRTLTNTFLDRYFRLSIGVYLRPEQLWGE